MGEFFKGRRRAIGVVTLVMASVLMMGWVRSLYVEDSLGFPNSGNGSVWLLSVKGRVGFTIASAGGYWWYTSSLTQHHFDSEGYVVTPSGVRLGGKIKWGDASGEIDPNPRNPVQRDGVPALIPLWPFVVMLVLVSAHLLFSTHRLLIKLEREIVRIIRRFRRVIGGAILLWTLAFTGWWVRSLVVHDCIYFTDFVNSDFAKHLVYPNIQRRIVGVATEKHSLIWLKYGSRIEITPTPYPPVHFPPFAKQSEAVGNVALEHEENEPTTTGLPALSTEVAPLKIAVVPFVVIPFWLIVLPLAIISTFLLSEPRKAIQKKITEPISTKVA